MALGKWEVSEKGMAQLLAQPSVTAYLRGLAERAVESARSMAPVDTGAYRDSLTVFEGSAWSASAPTAPSGT